MKSKIVFLNLVFVAVMGCGSRSASVVKEAWNSVNDPIRLAGDYVVAMASLPTTGDLALEPWSDTYWPSFKGGVSQRWRGNVSDQFAYVLNSREALQAMSAADLSALSPGEKYDIFLGRYEYPLVAYERRRTSPDREGWEGICHGWAPASLGFLEPKAVVMTNADGVAIPFGSSDVKALLSYFQGEMSAAPFSMLGERCYVDISGLPSSEIPQACRDTNAGAFHVVLVNQLAIKHQGFVADVTRDLQVWNQPVSGFDSVIEGEGLPSPGAATGTVKELLISTTMRYGVEVSPQWDHLVGTGRNSIASKQYRYRLELDQNDNIIGGEWLSESRPDFLWTQGKPAFTGYFTQLGVLYDAAVLSAGIVDPIQ